jgi:hypothetical protein
VLEEILQERVSSSQRLNPRGVKRKMSNYPLRPRKPERTRKIDFARQIRITNPTVVFDLCRLGPTVALGEPAM